MRIATWAWFSPRARVPRGAPCIFGSIQQARTAAYAPDIPYWSQRRLQRAVLVGGQTPLGQIGVLRAVPDHKMSSSFAILPDCSGAGGACVAEYSVFCTAQAGVHQDQKEHPSLFMQSVMESMQNTKRPHCRCPNSARGGSGAPPHAQIKQSRDAHSGSPPIYKRGSSAIPK